MECWNRHAKMEIEALFLSIVIAHFNGYLQLSLVELERKVCNGFLRN